MKSYKVRVYEDGAKMWLLNGKLHREDGPAYEWSDGTKEWRLNGKRHREDGPAIEWSSGTKEWWLYGEHLTKEEHSKKTSKGSCEGRTVVVDGIEYQLVKRES